MTSHDCVARVRRLLRLKRVGHGGTLDPAATGVLPIAIAQATRLLQFMRQDKAYRATIRLGIRTATDDLEGETLQEMPVPALNFELVKAALDGFVGEIQQVPPAYSAIQVQGQRLYDLARAGETVEVPARSVEVYKIEVLDWRPGDFPEIDAAIACGPGTYIRAIARDLGELLKTGGTLAALTRTASSGFALSDSLTFDELEAQLKQGTFQPVLPEVALQHIQSVILSAPNDRRWCQGQKIVDFRFSRPDSALKQSIESVGSESISISERDSDSYPFATPDNLVPLTQSNVLPPSENSYNPQPDRLKSKIDNPNSILRVYDDNGHFLGIGQLTHSEIEPLLIPQVVLNSIQ